MASGRKRVVSASLPSKKKRMCIPARTFLEPPCHKGVLSRRTTKTPGALQGPIKMRALLEYSAALASFTHTDCSVGFGLGLAKTNITSNNLDNRIFSNTFNVCINSSGPRIHSTFEVSAPTASKDEGCRASSGSKRATKAPFLEALARVISAILPAPFDHCGPSRTLIRPLGKPPPVRASSSAIPDG